MLEYRAIIFMKAGPHSGNTLEEIIKMKLEEQNKMGKFYWGYSGTLCHPFRVHKFIQEARKKNLCVWLLLSPTTSAYTPHGIKRCNEYSIDKEKWYKLPRGVHLWNCKFAVVASGLRRVDQYIDLRAYEVYEKKSRLDKYLKYKINKACAFLKEVSYRDRLAKISYVAKIVYPSCIFLR